MLENSKYLTIKYLLFYFVFLSKTLGFNPRLICRASLRDFICSLFFDICSLLFALCYLLFVICSLLFILCYLFFVICYLLFVICYLLFVLCYLFFVICYLFFVHSSTTTHLPCRRIVRSITSRTQPLPPF
jgi:hypothetical protein